MKPNKKKGALIRMAIPLNLLSWRNFLGGFLHGIRNHPNWNLQILNTSDSTTEVTDVHADGLVVGNISQKVAARLVTSSKPLTVIGPHATSIRKRRCNIAYVLHDDVDVGRCGARALCSTGKKNSYGFVAIENARWCQLREQGFSKEMASRKNDMKVFRVKPDSGESTAHQNLLRWLQDLPKPTAVMVAYDVGALRVLEACREGGLSVPDQVAIIGVEGDSTLCETSRPSLSCITPDNYYEGILAASAFEKLLRRASSRPSVTLCRRKDLHLRESTRPTKPAASLIRRAEEYIAKNVNRRITAADVAAHLGVSRQLVELRFRESGTSTLAGTIRALRLKEVRRQILSTNLSIGAIASNCGWSNVNHLTNVFKRQFGISMSALRKQYKRGF